MDTERFALSPRRFDPDRDWFGEEANPSRTIDVPLIDPYLVEPDLTFANAAAPANVLRVLLAALAAGAVLLFPSLGYLFRVFKSEHQRPK